MILSGLSILTLLASGYVICGNWWFVYVGLVKRKHESWIPLIGGALGCVGCLLSPYAVLNRYWWVPLLLDWGCVPGFGHCAVYYLVWLVRGRPQV